MEDSHSERRQFLKSGTGLLVLKPETVFGTQANSAVEVGLIGCGGRGNWIAPFFPEFAGARVVAAAEVIRERLDSTREKLKIPAARAYYGPEAHRELAQSRLDAVVIETPPYFHPEQAKSAVEAGKHVFCAKPVGVDVSGCLSFLETGKRAQGRLSFWVDFQTRAQPVFQELAGRIHRGAIGKPVLAQIFYYAGRVRRDVSQPGMDPGLARVMNMFLDRVLSGDIILDQGIHVLDMANWYLQSHPLKAYGTGGRTDWTGTEYNAGDCWDHFVVTYWYPNDVQATFSSHQLTRAFPDLCVRCFGLDGAVDSHYGGLVRIIGGNPWTGAEKDDTFRQGAINNVKHFIESIKNGKPVNNAERAVESNLTAILGRMSAYQNRLVTWDEMLASGECWTADLKLRW